jgi:hypothetical protein
MIERIRYGVRENKEICIVILPDAFFCTAR